MRKVTWLLAIVMVFTTMAPAFAAPLFPDVPEVHWARDAVADLAAKGVLEGYPDGTFKGDRAATRWELAVALQRLLAKMEAEHATFATKADLEALRALVHTLRDELDALGVRVRAVEEALAGLETRVTELERITFEGDFAARLVSVGLSTPAVTLGTPWDAAVGTVGGVDPTQAVGPANWVSPYYGTLDIARNLPLVNGMSFTARARLGVKVRVTRDVNAGVRFAAYTALGNSVLDAYWGVTAPYLSNPHTGYGVLAGVPWTNMNLDRFFVEHVPSGTRLVVGSIDTINFDSSVVAMVPNPSVDGIDYSEFEPIHKERRQQVSTWRYYQQQEDAYLPFYGVQLKGGTYFLSDMAWEAMYTRLPSDFTIVLGQNEPHLIGANLAWKVRDQWAVKVNFAAVSEDTMLATAAAANYYQNPMVDWVTPATFTGLVNPVDGAGQIGNQRQLMYGASFNYRFEPSNIRVVLEGAGSNYTPTVGSEYNVTGWMGRGGIGWTSRRGNFDIDVEYIHVTPEYDAFQLRYPVAAQGLAGYPVNVIFPTMHYFGQGYQIHDNALYPNNRSGARLGAEYRWTGRGDGRANLRAAYYQQVEASVEDFAGAGAYRPGFIETPVFGLLTGDATKGTVTNYGLTVEHRFSPSPFTARVSYDHYAFQRTPDANLVLNTVDLRNNVIKARLGYAFNDRFFLRGGADWANATGYHPDFNPGNVYAQTVNVVDVTQLVPHIGFDYEIARNTQWAVDVRYYNTTDNRGATFIADQTPFSFSALQLMTTFKVRF
jgi:hypothetical protein